MAIRSLGSTDCESGDASGRRWEERAGLGRPCGRRSQSDCGPISSSSGATKSNSRNDRQERGGYCGPGGGRPVNYVCLAGRFCDTVPNIPEAASPTASSSSVGGGSLAFSFMGFAVGEEYPFGSGGKEHDAMVA